MTKKLFSKKCNNCGKHFECNGGCVKIGRKYIRSSACFCPECARKFARDNIYPAELRKVCSRFIESQEKVEFT